jgi:hypothetical protein
MAGDDESIRKIVVQAKAAMIFFFFIIYLFVEYPTVLTLQYEATRRVAEKG